MPYISTKTRDMAELILREAYVGFVEESEKVEYGGFTITINIGHLWGKGKR